MSRYFPLFIDLEKKKITVIGAGTIASRRIRTLLNFGAQITVLAPEASEEVRKLAEKGRLVWRKGAYAPGLPGLLEDAVFVLAATDDREVNEAVRQECRTLGVPVNLSDDRKKCDFYSGNRFRSRHRGRCHGGGKGSQTCERSDRADKRAAVQREREAEHS